MLRSRTRRNTPRTPQENPVDLDAQLQAASHVGDKKLPDLLTLWKTGHYHQQTSIGPPPMEEKEKGSCECSSVMIRRPVCRLVLIDWGDQETSVQAAPCHAPVQCLSSPQVLSVVQSVELAL